MLLQERGFYFFKQKMRFLLDRCWPGSTYKPDFPLNFVLIYYLSNYVM